jgi:hypothetical protein
MGRSRVETLLGSILNGEDEGIEKPASRVEELLKGIYDEGGGGGGEGTMNYNALHNLPQLNGITIKGNHDLEYYAPDETAEEIDTEEEQELLNILD